MKREITKIALLSLTMLALLAISFVSLSPYIFKNSSLAYKESDIKFTKTFWDRDVCSINRWDKTTQDIKNLKENELITVTDFFFSPGLDKCLYKWTQEDTTGRKHYFIKEVQTGETVYEISPYNPLQRLKGQYSDDYFNKFAEKISEIPDVEEEIARINSNIAINGPEIKCATPEELSRWITDCEKSFKDPWPTEEFLTGIKNECNSEEKKKRWIANYILIDPDSFGFTRNEISNLADKYVTGSAYASNGASQNDLLKRPLYFSAFWDEGCWNLTKLSLSKIME